jgi:hypothetical protein
VRDIIRRDLAASLDPVLVDQLLEAHVEAKQNLYLGGLRLNAVEGGRFCEAAFRMLQQYTSKDHKFTPLNKPLPDTEVLIRELANLPSSDFTDSIRIHIPRSLRVIYDIRSKRNTVHLADGIDPNLQDATLVVSIVDWVLAELVRIFHKVPPDKAQRIVETLVTRNTPIVADFDGYPKVLNPSLPAALHCLVVLYHRDRQGGAFKQLYDWARPPMRSNLQRTLTSLVHEKAFVHFDGNNYYITPLGQKEVEKRNLVLA